MPHEVDMPIGHYRREDLALRVWQPVREDETAVMVLRWSLPVTRPSADAGTLWELTVEFWVGDLDCRSLFDGFLAALDLEAYGTNPGWDEVEELLSRHGYVLTEDLPL